MTPSRFGRYQILGLLGRGGMADVFLARAEGAEGVAKRLALKRIRPHLADRPGFLEMFVVEARIAVELTHANIVPVFDFGRVGDAYFLAMEYVEGRDLGALLARARESGSRLPAPLVAYLAAQVASALDYAHRRDVVHRDIAPRNVLINTEGEVRLGDFGVALRGDDPSGALRGTLTYMAPEQALGGEVDGRADLFALGMVMIEALSGEKPRESLDPQVALAQARAAQVPDIPSDTPDALAAIARHATKAAAADRYATSRAMLEDLEAYLRSAPASPRLLADELSTLFEGRPAAPIAPAPDDLPGEADGAEATYLGGQMTSLSTMRAHRGRRPWLVALGAAALTGIGLAAWSWLRPFRAAPLAPKRAAPVAPTPHPAAPAPSPGPPASPSPPPRTPAAARTARATGTLDLNADPWASVSIDDRLVGDTPLVGVRLPAGTHRLHLENRPLGLAKDIVIEIEAGKNRVEIVRLRP